jgi:hypothetical protein
MLCAALLNIGLRLLYLQGSSYKELGDYNVIREETKSSNLSVTLVK